MGAAAVDGSAARPRFYERRGITEGPLGRELEIINSAVRPRFYGRREIISSAAWLLHLYKD